MLSSLVCAENHCRQHIWQSNRLHVRCGMGFMEKCNRRDAAPQTLPWTTKLLDKWLKLQDLTVAKADPCLCVLSRRQMATSSYCPSAWMISSSFAATDAHLTSSNNSPMLNASARLLSSRLPHWIKITSQSSRTQALQLSRILQEVLVGLTQSV